MGLKGPISSIHPIQLLASFGLHSKKKRSLLFEPIFSFVIRRDNVHSLHYPSLVKSQQVSIGYCDSRLGYGYVSEPKNVSLCQDVLIYFYNRYSLQLSLLDIRKQPDAGQQTLKFHVQDLTRDFPTSAKSDSKNAYQLKRV